MALTYPRMLDKAPQGRDDSITLAAADPFIISALTLFGARWKAPLARTLGVSRETVSRWVSSGHVPKWASTALALLSAAKGSVLSLCDRTGNMVQPWAAAGFECFCVDTRHPQGEHRRGNITFIGADLREWLPPPRRYAIAFAFPPCTHTARTAADGATPGPVSGTRGFRTKDIGGLTEALELVEACRRICEWSRAPWMIENPVSTIGSYRREPDLPFTRTSLAAGREARATTTASAPPYGRAVGSGYRSSGPSRKFARSTSTICRRPTSAAIFAASPHQASRAPCSRRI